MATKDKRITGYNSRNRYWYLYALRGCRSHVFIVVVACLVHRICPAQCCVHSQPNVTSVRVPCHLEHSTLNGPCAVLRCHMAMVLLPPLPAQSALCQWQQRWLNVSGIIFPVPFTNQNTCVMCINLGLFPHTLCKGCLHCRITQKSETKIWYEREANGRWTWKQQQQKLKKKIKQKRRETDKKKTFPNAEENRLSGCLLYAQQLDIFFHWKR